VAKFKKNNNKRIELSIQIDGFTPGGGTGGG
jgi:hypothetical protein